MHDSSQRLRWCLRGLGLLALIVLVGVGLSASLAQIKEPEKGVGPLSSDLALVAASGSGYLVLTPSELLAHPLMKQMPARQRENLMEMEKELSRKMGLSVSALKRFTVVLPSGLMQQPIGLLLSEKALDVETLKKNLGEGWKQAKGEHGPIFRTERNNECLTLFNPSLLVVGREREVNVFLARAEKGAPDVALVRGLEAAQTGAHLVAGMRPDDFAGYFGLAQPLDRRAMPMAVPTGPAKDFAPGGAQKKDDFRRDEFKKDEPRKDGVRRRPLPADAFQVAAHLHDHEHDGPRTLAEMLRELPPQMLPFKPLLVCRSAHVAVKLGEDTATVTAQFNYARAEQVDDAQASARITLYVLREVLPRWWLEEIGLKKETAVATVRALDRMGEALAKAEVKAAGTSVQASLSLPLDPAIVGVLLREMEFPSISTERMNNLKQVGLAMHNYESVYNQLPGCAYYVQNKPALSWRVAVLPYIEQEALFKQFKLDEPWDGPNNIKLLDKMPKLFAPPAGVKAEVGHTFIQAFSGPGTMFDPMTDRKQAMQCMGNRLVATHDGTSNTFMAGESGKAVPWTKPEDIACGGQGVPPLGYIEGSDRCLVLFGDGSVRAITNRPPAELFRAFVSRAGGEVTDPDQLDPRRQPRP